MSEIEKPIADTTKAGNSQKLTGKHSIIDWERKTIIHKYSVELVDSDGDSLLEMGSGNVLLEEADFDLWINQEMKDATLESIEAQYLEAQQEAQPVE